MLHPVTGLFLLCGCALHREGLTSLTFRVCDSVACGLVPISVQLCAAQKLRCAHSAFASQMAAKHPVELHVISALPRNSVFLVRKCSAGSIPIVTCVWTEIHVLQLWLLLQHCPLWQDRIRRGISHTADTEVRTLPSPPTKPLGTSAW